jgi:hypothetical protein
MAIDSSDALPWRKHEKARSFTICDAECEAQAWLDCRNSTTGLPILARS